MRYGLRYQQIDTRQIVHANSDLARTALSRLGRFLPRLSRGQPTPDGNPCRFHKEATGAILRQIGALRAYQIPRGLPVDNTSVLDLAA